MNILPRAFRVLPPGCGRKGGFAASAVELPTVSREWTRFISKTLKKTRKTLITVVHTHGMIILQGFTVAYGLAMLGFLKGLS